MPVLLFLVLVFLHIYIRVRYLHFLIRIFQEKPLFVIPRGQPLPEAEEVRFPTSDGLMLSGCYLRATQPRRGVILFGLEFGSNRWSCRSYCEHLVENGFDVFAFESRNQGSSDAMPGYEPLQWVTTYEVRDAEAALAYLKSRPDADPRGVGFFGISKGASAGLMAAARDPYVRCCVTDGVFATYTTLVPYMQQWFRIYNTHYAIQGLIPVVVLRPDRSGGHAANRARAPLPFPAPGELSAAAGAAAAADDPRPGRHLHQAGHGHSTVRVRPRSPRNCGWSRTPSTIKPSRSPARNTASECCDSLKRTWPKPGTENRHREGHATPGTIGRSDRACGTVCSASSTRTCWLRCSIRSSCC